MQININKLDGDLQIERDYLSYAPQRDKDLIKVRSNVILVIEESTE